MLTIGALHLGFCGSMGTESASFENLFSMWRASNLSLENVEKLVAQVLLIEELDNETCDLFLDLWVRMAH